MCSKQTSSDAPASLPVSACIAPVIAPAAEISLVVKTSVSADRDPTQALVL